MAVWLVLRFQVQNGLCGGKADGLVRVPEQLRQESYQTLGSDSSNCQGSQDVYALYCLGVGWKGGLFSEYFQHDGFSGGVAQCTELLGGGESDLRQVVVKHGDDGVFCFGGAECAHGPDTHDPEFSKFAYG